MKKFILSLSAVISLSLNACLVEGVNYSPIQRVYVQNEPGECLWMENYSGSYKWVSANAVYQRVLSKAECLNLDRCSAGGACYKWVAANKPVVEAAPVVSQQVVTKQQVVNNQQVTVSAPVVVNNTITQPAPVIQVAPVAVPVKTESTNDRQKWKDRSHNWERRKHERNLEKSADKLSENVAAEVKKTEPDLASPVTNIAKIDAKVPEVKKTEIAPNAAVQQLDSKAPVVENNPVSSSPITEVKKSAPAAEQPALPNIAVQQVEAPAVPKVAENTSAALPIPAPSPQQPALPLEKCYVKNAELKWIIADSISNKADCFEQNSCGQGGGKSNGVCYKWSVSADAEPAW